jgi:predicted RND superfamily exporter protein
MQHAMRVDRISLREAFVSALRQRGTASLFTAVTMTLSVSTWAFSTLKFQADMGILLAFMFLVNVFGALLLLPALAAFIVGDRLDAEPSVSNRKSGGAVSAAAVKH